MSLFPANRKIGIWSPDSIKYGFGALVLELHVIKNDIAYIALYQKYHSR